MAQTDARAGFRLPWSQERSNIEQAETDQVENSGSDVAGDWPATDAAPVTDPHADSASPSTDPGWEAPATGDAAADHGSAASPEPEPVRSPTAKKPSKFLADLTKAMQSAAEEARNATLTQFQAEAKTHIEGIHERSATEANTLRRQADDDVAAVREWSKAEIARVREETETKITARKGRLETEIEQHAAMIEREIEQVQGKVAGFEEEMAQFFEHLLAEDDPTHFATMAENLPEPPGFDSMPELDPVEFAAQVAYEAAIAEPVAGESETDAEATTDGEAAWGEAEAAATDEAAGDMTAESATEGEAQVGEAEAEAATGEAETAETAWPEGTLIGEGEAMPDFPDGEVPEGFEMDREAAFAAIQAAAEAAASAEVATDAAARAEAVADIAIEIVGSHEDGTTTDFASAEAEAAAATDTGEPIQEIGDDALAARLAGLVPAKGGKAASGDTKSTQVVVVGLVSVASIASFKRHLGRLSGVQSVGVSSGPDGEFLFAVTHDAECSLRDTIPGLPSFQARVTGSSEGVLNVTAHDPEADN
jgi:hypothetical protein